MPIKFQPVYTLTPKIIANLLRIEAVRGKVTTLPVTPQVLASLRESARLRSTHFSTQIEGNRLSLDEVAQVVLLNQTFPGRQRDELEVRGYMAALHKIEQWAARGASLTEEFVQELYTLVMGGGKTLEKQTPYRDGQNVIRDGRTSKIVYLPPEAKDVAGLMAGLVVWVRDMGQQVPPLPSPIMAALVHYQFATIHPYYDGNGRTARLLATFLLQRDGYGLNGVYEFEEYYARDLDAYYAAIAQGPSHNYYFGRADADITRWVDYFIEGLAIASELVLARMIDEQQRGMTGQQPLLQQLDPQQRKILYLFELYHVVTARQIGDVLGYGPRTRSKLCKKWVDAGFLEVVNIAKKSRSYRLTPSGI